MYWRRKKKMIKEKFDFNVTTKPTTISSPFLTHTSPFVYGNDLHETPCFKQKVSETIWSWVKATPKNHAETVKKRSKYQRTRVDEIPS